jgi:hypothetical protein
MRMLRHAILAGAASLVLPLGGFTSQISNALLIAQNLLTRTAEATSWDTDFQVTGVRIRSGPSTSSAVRGMGNPGEHASRHRSVAGEAITCPDGRSTTEWFHITDRRTRVDGYVSACYV